MNNMELKEMTVEELEVVDGGIGVIGSLVLGGLAGVVVVGGGYELIQLFK